MAATNYGNFFSSIVLSTYSRKTGQIFTVFWDLTTLVLHPASNDHSGYASNLTKKVIFIYLLFI
jgi:hypothetical protein